MRVLFFDTETSGLPLWGEPSSDPRQPHLCDIAIELRDDETGELIDEFEAIINPGVPISDEAAAIHGITTEIATEQGIPTEEALYRFLTMVDEADLIVGHNVDFDLRMIRVAMFRHRNEDWSAPVPSFCTMKATTGVCKIPKDKGRGWKWPKLTEAIRHFFDEELEDAHRAKPDMLACQRVYFHLRPLKASDGEPA